MKKVSEYFRWMVNYGTDIQLMIMKGTLKVITRLVKVATVDYEIERMLLRKELLEWVNIISNLLVNMGQAYNFILVHCTTFIRLKLESFSGWEATS